MLLCFDLLQVNFSNPFILFYDLKLGWQTLMVLVYGVYPSIFLCRGAYTRQTILIPTDKVYSAVRIDTDHRQRGVLSDNK